MIVLLGCNCVIGRSGSVLDLDRPIGWLDWRSRGPPRNDTQIYTPIYMYLGIPLGARRRDQHHRGARGLVRGDLLDFERELARLVVRVGRAVKLEAAVFLGGGRVVVGGGVEV